MQVLKACHMNSLLLFEPVEAAAATLVPERQPEIRMAVKNILIGNLSLLVA